MFEMSTAYAPQASSVNDTATMFDPEQRISATDSTEVCSRDISSPSASPSHREFVLVKLKAIFEQSIASENTMEYV